MSCANDCKSMISGYCIDTTFLTWGIRKGAVVLAIRLPTFRSALVNFCGGDSS